MLVRAKAPSVLSDLRCRGPMCGCSRLRILPFLRICGIDRSFGGVPLSLIDIACIGKLISAVADLQHEVICKAPQSCPAISRLAVP